MRKTRDGGRSDLDRVQVDPDPDLFLKERPRSGSGSASLSTDRADAVSSSGLKRVKTFFAHLIEFCFVL